MTDNMGPHRSPLLAQIRQGTVGFQTTIYETQDDGKVLCLFYHYATVKEAVDKVARVLLGPE